MYGLISRALHVWQLLLHFLISGVALGPGRGSQKRFRSLSILCTIFESSSLARVSCFLMFLSVLKVTEGLFGKSLESSGDFSMRCQCLTSSFLRWYVGMCGLTYTMDIQICKPHSSANLVIKGLIYLEARACFSVHI